MFSSTHSTMRSGRRIGTAVVLVALLVALTPATAAWGAGLDVVGKSSLGGAGLNGEVAVLGDTAIVGSGILGASGVRSSYRTTYPCPETTAKVVDLSSPSAPRVAATIPVVKNAVASDVALLDVNTPSFVGRLAAVALVRCNFDGNFTERGVAYYDVTSRANPAFLGRYDADQNRELPADPPCGPDPNPADNDFSTGERCASSQDQVALVQRADGRVLSLSTEPFSSNSQGPTFPTPNSTTVPREDFHGDLRIVDVTNPRSPVEVGSYPNGPATAGGPDQRFPGFGASPANPRTGQSNNGCRPFDSGYGPAAFPDGSKALLASFDQGLVTVDLANPASPFGIGQFSYDRADRALEGNGAYVNFASVGGRSLALMGETDWIAPETRLRVDAPSSIAGSKFGCEAMFTLFDPEDTAQIYRQPGSQVSGEIVYVGRACPQDVLLANPAGKIAFRDQSLVASRQGGSGFCSLTDASTRLQDAGAKGTVVGAIQNAAGTARVQTFSGDGDPPESLSTPTMGLDTVPTIELRDVLCPAPAVPGTGCGPGGQPVTGAMVDTRGDWGTLRVVDVSNPAGPTLRGTYRSPGSQVFPPRDRGVYSVHHAVASGSRAYVAAHADGVRVIDLTSASLAETASFVPPDTPDPTGSIPPKAHVTGVDAGPGGTIVISDMNSGLYVLRAAGAAGAPAPSPVPQPTPPFAGCPQLTANVIRGSSVGNVINGTERADRIFAADGDDTVNALAGADCVDLGAGTDRGRGGAGSDLILGGLGRDRISGSSGGDRISGGSGRDTISGGSSRDRISGGSGGDRLGGNSGNDRIAGGSAGDRINGGSGRDIISGGSGNDRIAGRDRHRDRISCGPGRDSVVADRSDRVSRDCERVRRRR